MVTRLGPGPEFDLIRRFLGAAGSSGAAAAGEGAGVRIGAGDDCAVVAGDGIAVTVDMSVENVHFRRDWLDAEEIGYRAAAGALSDLAAMAARPIAILASIGLADGDETGFGETLMGGVAAAAGDLGAALIGGDLVRSPGPLIVDIVALGEAPDPVLRSGAMPGDEVWVTGSLGAAAAAVAAWLRGDAPSAAARAAFAKPRPRTREALWLADRGVPAALIDLSDGLSGDAAHIAAASGVRILLDAARIPVSAAAEGGGDALALAAAGGDDYELCLVARPGAADAVRGEFESRFDVSLTRVGRVEEGAGAVVLDEQGTPMELSSWQHWREG